MDCHGSNSFSISQITINRIFLNSFLARIFRRVEAKSRIPFQIATSQTISLQKLDDLAKSITDCICISCCGSFSHDENVFRQIDAPWIRL